MDNLTKAMLEQTDFVLEQKGFDKALKTRMTKEFLIAQLGFGNAMLFAAKYSPSEILNEFLKMKQSKYYLNAALLTATRSGNLRTVRVLDQALAIEDALKIAARAGNVELVKYFVSKKAINYNQGLCKGARAGNMEIVKMMLDLKAIDIRKAAAKAAQSGNMTVFNFLLNLVTNQDEAFWESILEKAANANNLPLVKLAMDKGARNLYAASLSASKGGALDVVKFFLERGETGGGIALARAIANRHYDVMEVLLQQEVSHIHFALEEALKMGDVALFDRLMATDNSKISPLYHFDSLKAAAMSGNLDLVIKIYDLGHRDVKEAAKAAAEHNHREVLDFLIGKGANNWSELTVAAAGGGNLELMQIMMSLSSGRWKSAPGLAASNGHVEIVEFLLTKVKFDRSTAMELAALHGHLDVIQLLVDNGATRFNGGLRASVHSKSVSTVLFFLSKGASDITDALRYLENKDTDTRLLLQDQLKLQTAQADDLT